MGAIISLDPKSILAVTLLNAGFVPSTVVTTQSVVPRGIKEKSDLRGLSNATALGAEVLPSQLNEPYFVQTPRFDPGFVSIPKRSAAVDMK